MKSFNRKVLVVVVLLLSVMLVGCGGSWGTKVTPSIPGEPRPPDVPARGDLEVGEGPRTPFRGRVVFGDTGFVLPWSAVEIGDVGPLMTDEGHLSTPLPEGNNGYWISIVPLGQGGGVVLHNGASPKDLKFPAFEEWDPVAFNNMIVNSTDHLGSGVWVTYITRWKRGEQIPFAVSYAPDVAITHNAVEDVVLEAFHHWESVMNGMVSFQHVDELTVSPELWNRPYGISVRVVTDEEMADGSGGNTLGRCRSHIHPGHERGEPLGRLFLGEIQVKESWAHDLGLYMHEIGHCIGLGHSPHIEDLMFPTIARQGEHLSPRDINMARLLYSLDYYPKGQIRNLETPDAAPTQLRAAMQPQEGYMPNEDGVLVKIIQTEQSD